MMGGLESHIRALANEDGNANAGRQEKYLFAILVFY